VTCSGRVALVTGAASGLGRLSALRLAADGVRVAALDVDERGLADAARRTDLVHPFVCDVSDDAAVRAVVEQAEDELGPVHRVVNAAAVLPLGRLADTPAAEITRAMEINFGGLVNVTSATLPGMVARRRGDLVQYASLAAWVPTPYLGAYAATKAAVASYTETLHQEHRQAGVRMVCVCPPPVDTPMGGDLEALPAGMSSPARLAPELVLDEVERALESGRFWVFPGRGTRTVSWVRRAAPQLLWRRLHALGAA
jgi:NAD(P)-dependent dehydrogenase (short-subunit alcohol dehydrogenase family)